ncbi:hypothetical protein BVX97_05725 [bacterium E08(2017)]|nr:hypothetical protein BVX97_05725 [bacterium E08(2017)]
MVDANDAGCNIFYAGQYLSPTKQHLPVCRYIKPNEFKNYEAMGYEIGFDVVVSAPLVRSSYHSEKQRRWIWKNMM